MIIVVEYVRDAGHEEACNEDYFIEYESVEAYLRDMREAIQAAITADPKTHRFRWYKSIVYHKYQGTHEQSIAIEDLIDEKIGKELFTVRSLDDFLADNLIHGEKPYFQL